MVLSINQYDAILDFISRFDQKRVERCCMNLSFPNRQRDEFEGVVINDELIREYLDRVISKDWKKLKKLIESLFDRVVWLDSDYYDNWITYLNKILNNSNLFFNTQNNKIQSLKKGWQISKQIQSYLVKINKLSDYQNALRCFEQRFYIASMLYLRRVLEELMFVSVPSLRSERNKHFENLYKQSKDKFSPLVRKHINANYKSISTFVHTSIESKAKKYFEILRFIVDTEINDRVYKKHIPQKIMENIEKISTKMLNQIREFETKEKK